MGTIAGEVGLREVEGRNPDTGDAKSAYQFVAHDAWDYDEIMENILVDMPVNGQMRKLLVQAPSPALSASSPSAFSSRPSSPA